MSKATANCSPCCAPKASGHCTAASGKAYGHENAGPSDHAKGKDGLSNPQSHSLWQSWQSCCEACQGPDDAWLQAHLPLKPRAIADSRCFSSWEGFLTVYSMKYMSLLALALNSFASCNTRLCITRLFCQIHVLLTVQNTLLLSGVHQIQCRSSIPYALHQN